jgi:hypothetical protein
MELLAKIDPARRVAAVFEAGHLWCSTVGRVRRSQREAWGSTESSISALAARLAVNLIDYVVGEPIAELAQLQ